MDRIKTMVRKVMTTIFIMASFFTMINAADYSVQKYIPKNFSKYKDTLYTSVTKTMADEFKIDDGYDDIFFVSYFGGLIEHENCISLRYNSCWNPKTQFKTKWKSGLNREQGAGLAMITRAWRSNGQLRFDNVNNLRKKYPKYLGELTWDNITDRPDLQIMAAALLYKSNYIRLSTRIPILDRVAMADSAYNGGLGYVIKDRKVCGLKANCDPDLWFDNVETINNRGTKKLYGNRSAQEINRNHVRDVIFNRFGKYYEFYISEKIDMSLPGL